MVKIMSKQSDPKDVKFEDHFFGSVTVGERGQVVIPAEARKRYKIETGDKLLVLSPPHDKGIMLCKIDDFRQFMQFFLDSFQAIEESLKSDEENEA
jgi:AbrB family looped-hinge helix DNA binding protein